MLIFSVIAVIAVVLDVITKYFAINLFSVSEFELIKNVLYFTYLENRGAAFGILQNQRWFFIAVTAIVLLCIIIWILYKKPESKLLLLSLGMLAGGGVGNFIDRIRFSYVVDFIDVRIINYPVFNVADCFVVIGAVLMIIYILFFEGKKYERDKD